MTLTGTGSYARREQPRSVPDPLEGPYNDMVARQRELNSRNEGRPHGRWVAAPPSLTGSPIAETFDADAREFNHPGALESMIPIWGSGKEALADYEDGNYLGAAINAGLAASDVFLVKAAVSGMAKGGLKMAGPHVWRKWEKGKATGARPWLVEKKFVKKGQPAHHWAFEQHTKVPDVIKNQPLFIKPMKDAVQHGRVHHPYTVDGVRLPRFNPVQRLWYGTPQWAKAGYVSSAGHSGIAAGRTGADQDDLRRRR